MIPVEGKRTSWMEVSLTVSGELAEAVADAFARVAGNGVSMEQGVTHLDAEDEGTAAGPVTVRAYLPADEHLESSRRSLDVALRALSMIQPLPPATFRPIPDQNWMHAWRAHYRPIPVGSRLVVMPAWLDAADPGRLAIKIDPGMAFGTGTHPSTQLCLELIESAMRQGAGSDSPTPSAAPTFMDVGCGSGILSIAALKLGAKQALAVDIDPTSVDNTRQNAKLNGIGESLQVGAGSVAEVLDRQFVLERATLVAVNILAPVIIRLFNAGLQDLVEEHGQIILGGILADQAEEVRRAAETAGLSLTRTIQQGDWVALLMQRSGR